MIVSHVEEGWIVVYQPAHGLLAGALADHLAEEYRCNYWFETMAAIIAHDDIKVPFKSGERSYISDTGAPKDFTQVSMSAKERFHEVQDRLENAYRKHRWIGLIESKGERFFMWETPQESVSIEPWPFKPDGFELSLEVRLLEQLTFDDDASLKNALDRVQPSVRSWSFIAPSKGA